MERKDAAKIFKALGDDHRLQILQLLCEKEKCACDLLEALDISQPTLSHHMKILCDAQIVEAIKDGKWMHYSINIEKVTELEKMFAYLSNIKENMNLTK